MGREILYCTKCGKALTADDFTRGRAHTFDNRQFCAKCLPPRVDPAPTPRPAKRAPSSTRLPPHAPPKRSPLPVVLGVVAALGVAVVLVVLTRPAPPPPPAPEAPSRKLLDDARDYARAHAKSPEDVARRWEEAVAAAAGGPLAAEAKRELDRALVLRKEAETRELEELDAKTRERQQAEQFGAVLDVLEEARKRHATSDWAKAVESRVQQLRSTTDQLYPGLKAKAVAAQTQGRATEVEELREKLGIWRRKDLLGDLDAELAKIVPKASVPAGAVVVFQFPNEGPRAYNNVGSVKDGALVSPLYGAGSVMGGWEVLREPFAIPAKGELWLTYSTTCAKSIIVRFRVIRGDKTVPFNWTIEKPEVGRPVRVKIPLREFMDYNNKYVEVGERVLAIYIQQEDPKAQLLFFEAVAFRAP